MITIKRKKNIKRNIAYGTRKGYKRVILRYKGKYIACSAHRLIWTYFNGKIPEELTINHIDGKKDNNDIKNLELATYKYQIYHAAYITKTKNDMQRENNTNSKITMDCARKIRAMRRNNYKLREIKSLLNIDITLKQICKISKNKQWIEENEMV